MTLDAVRSRRRLALIVLLTLLPWPAVWLGMYHFDNLIWTFVLYHGACLLPAAYFGRRLWLPAWRWPTKRQWITLLIGIAIAVPLTLKIYAIIGSDIISSDDLLNVVTDRGFHARWLLPLCVYFIPVNAVLEELFWRGVVLNELRGLSEEFQWIGAAWTAVTFGAWHYLVIRLLLLQGWAEATTLVIMLAGVFLAWLYRRTGSIVVPILWHGLIFDLALLLVFGVIVHVGIH